MSAHDQVRAMLDELMGTARDGDSSSYKVKFDDPRVCKSFLLGCCPHDILASTRMDLGDCPSIHDLALRADYERAAKAKDYYYDIDAMEHLQNFIADCDRKTELAKRRLKETQEELSEEANQKADQIHQMGEQIGTKMAGAEEMGAQGLVDESLKLMEEIEDIKKKKATLEVEFRNSMPASSYQQQKLRVCEVCGAYLGIHDNDRRLADHFGGKLHLGFITIRTKLDDLKNLVTERRAQREKEREELRKKREEEFHERSASKQRSRSGSRERTRDNDRDRRRRSRSRDGSRRKRRSSRSCSRDRRRRRSRSRDRRSRSGSGSRRSEVGSMGPKPANFRLGTTPATRSRSRNSRSHRSGRRSRSRSGSRHRRRHRRSSESGSEGNLVSAGPPAMKTKQEGNGELGVDTSDVPSGI